MTWTLVDSQAVTDWQASLIPTVGEEYQVRFTCPECNTPQQLNVQLGENEETAGTQLWCHRNSLGADVEFANLP